MKKFLIFFIPKVMFRFVVSGIAIIALVGAMLLGSISPALVSSIGALAATMGFSTVSQKLADKKAKSDKIKKQKAKKINKRMNWRLKRIAVANTLGALTTIAVPVAVGFAVYEAWMICENSNDNRKLLLLLGVDPEPDTIADSCENIERKWDETANWVKKRVLRDVDQESSTGPVLVHIDDKWVDINTENWWENL